MSSADGRWTVSFNGEIYNHADLRQELGLRCRSRSDTETLVETISAIGFENAVGKFNGIFGLSAVDRKNGLLYLARDPFGVKPLYYCNAANGFSFASELRALHRLSPGNRQLDRAALADYLAMRFIPSPSTLWKGVSRLRPGHFLKVELSAMQVETKAYVGTSTSRFQGTLREAADEYQERLKEAVGRQLMSDVPIGILLSGGIDSAMVAAAAVSLTSHPTAYTVGFGEGHDDCEIESARETARILDLDFHSIELNARDFFDHLPAVQDAVEEPLGTTSIVPMSILCKRVQQDLKVVLTGQGTDEPWGGYRRCQNEILAAALPCSRGIARLAVFLGVDRIASDPVRRALSSWKHEDTADRMIETYGLFPRRWREAVMERRGDSQAKSAAHYWSDLLGCDKRTRLEGSLILDTRLSLPDDLLLYGDKVSMAWSLEARVPMLDIELMRFVEALPISYKVRWQKTKIVHKLAAAQYLPQSIIQRKKRGFQVPFLDWAKTEYRDWLHDLLLDPNAPHLCVFNRGLLGEMLTGFMQGKRTDSRQLFAITCLALWFHRERPSSV